MRVFFVAGLVALSFGAAACSGGTEDTTLRRSPGAPARTQAPAGAGDDTSDEAPSSTPASTPSTPGDAPSPAPAPAPDGGAAPAPPPAPGSCSAPKCFGLAGFGGCKATDGAGTLVTLACKDGACVCLTGGQPTTTFEGDVNSGEDARQLFVASCACH